MTTNDARNSSTELSTKTPLEAQAQAQANYSALFVHLCDLYTGGESTSISQSEAYDLLASLSFVLGDNVLESDELATCADPLELLAQGRERVRAQVRRTKELWQEVNNVMPPIHNIALRDTLVSIGEFEQHYDIWFAAHEIPCSIDYPLHKSIDESLQGVEYVQAWLTQALDEARFIAQFDCDECIALLEKEFPDYRGLLINLYEPILKYAQEGKLKPHAPNAM